MVNNSITEAKKISPNDDVIKCHSATIYMKDGRSLYCACGHSYNGHRIGHIGYWYDANAPMKILLPPQKKSIEVTSDTDSDESNHVQPKAQKTQKIGRGKGESRAQRAHRAHSKQKGAALDFDINKVKIVNLMHEQCDILIGRIWPKSNPPLAMEDYLGNPYVILKEGKEPSKPWECKTRQEALAKYKEFLYYGKEVVNGRDPGEYRRVALEHLPGHYKWGCFCAPEKCHGEILRSWL